MAGNSWIEQLTAAPVLGEELSGGLPISDKDSNSWDPEDNLAHRDAARPSSVFGAVEEKGHPGECDPGTAEKFGPIGLA